MRTRCAGGEPGRPRPGGSTKTGCEKRGVIIDARREDGSTIKFATVCRIDTPVEIGYYRNGGILQTVLRKMLKA